uniref:C-type lectin domain-containing protein n=1 Tax=Caenorhabditis japonica TaxID=281687 RepID=A0A8R1DVE3_CAEJA
MSDLKRLILLIVSSSLISAQSIKDASFIRFCDTQDGTYMPIGRGPKIASGNACEVPFIHWAKTEKLRWEFCTEYIPHTVLATKVVDRNTYTCLVESRVACDDGWVQLHGICHKLIYEAMTKPEARARCQKERSNARIALYHRPWMTRHWQDFFRDAIKLWVDATETITERLIYKRGPELMFAHDTLEYGLHSGAFVSVKSHKKAWPLCAYTPPVTQAQSDYLMNRYSEIYYKTLLTPSGDRYIRSASSLQRDAANRDAERLYCENVMKPVLRSLNAQSALPTRELIDTINKNTPIKSTLIRFSAYSGDSSKKNRISGTCTESKASNYGMNLFAKKAKKTFFMRIPDENQNVWGKGEPRETCDGEVANRVSKRCLTLAMVPFIVNRCLQQSNIRNAQTVGEPMSAKLPASVGAVNSSRSWYNSQMPRSRDNPGLEAMSDARHGPIYCQSLFKTVKYIECPDGWKTYERKATGQRWCRKFFPNRITHQDAEKTCVENRAHLDGFEDETELRFMDSMLDEAKLDYYYSNGHTAWLGAKRREICMKEKGGFNRDPNHQCSRRRVFEWVHGVARNSPNFDSHWASPSEPNMKGNEPCLELLKGPSRAYAEDGQYTKDVTMKINDADCRGTRYFFCGKEAQIVFIPLVYS